MASSSKRPNGVHDHPEIVELATNNENLLAALAKNFESLVHKFDIGQPPPSPLRSHASTILHE